MELDLDEDGYLSRLEDWCKLAAIALGKTADIELTSQHWIVTVSYTHLTLPTIYSV